MKQRCYSPKNPSYKYYSAKKITVCKEWLESFEAFKRWALENGYDYEKSRKEQSLDRMDNAKGYSPNNCRFVSHSENCLNTDRNVYLTADGITKTLSEWSKETRLPIETIRQRMMKTDDVKIILEKEKMAHRSNTGIKGISKNKYGRYVVYIKHQYIGSYRTLSEAITMKEKHNVK